MGEARGRGGGEVGGTSYPLAMNPPAEACRGKFSTRARASVSISGSKFGAFRIRSLKCLGIGSFLLLAELERNKEKKHK